MTILVIEMINIKKKISLTEPLRCLIIFLGKTNEATMKYYFKRSFAHLQIYGKPFCSKEFSFQKYRYVGREVYEDIGPSIACYRLGEKNKLRPKSNRMNKLQC